MDYKTPLPPFKWFILENFPYIEEDFDALTNWQLFCKLGKEMNKIIEKTNLTGEQVEQLTNAFNELKAYIDNYFENLDVQDEIDNKLDEMAESGQLTDIIAQYLQLAGVLAYDTKTAMKNATNLVDGSIAKTLGNNTYSDGQGAFYKVRQIQNTDVVDDENIIALNEPNLVAEKIQYSSGYAIQQQINTINSDVDLINSERTILIGDSYSLYRPETQGIEGWAVPLRRKLGLNETNCPILTSDGGGFITTGSLGTFENAIRNATISDPSTIKNIIVCGGLNDSTETPADILTAIQSFVSYCNTTYPNAKIYIGHIGNVQDGSSGTEQTVRWYCFKNSIPAYKECTKFGAIYLNGVEYVMKDYANYYDVSHPNQTLCLKLADSIYQAFKHGSVSVEYPSAKIQLSYDSVTGDKFYETQLPFDEAFVDNKDLILNYQEVSADLTYKTNATINSHQLILAVMHPNYFRNVFPNFKFADCRVIFTKTDDSVYECGGFLEMYYYNGNNYLVLNIDQPSSPITVKKLGFRQINSIIDGRLC